MLRPQRRRSDGKVRKKGRGNLYTYQISQYMRDNKGCPSLLDNGQMWHQKWTFRLMSAPETFPLIILLPLSNDTAVFHFSHIIFTFIAGTRFM